MCIEPLMSVCVPANVFQRLLSLGVMQMTKKESELKLSALKQV